MRAGAGSGKINPQEAGNQKISQKTKQNLASLHLISFNRPGEKLVKQPCLLRWTWHQGLGEDMKQWRAHLLLFRCCRNHVHNSLQVLDVGCHISYTAYSVAEAHVKGEVGPFVVVKTLPLQFGLFPVVPGDETTNARRS